MQTGSVWIVGLIVTMGLPATALVETGREVGTAGPGLLDPRLHEVECAQDPGGEYVDLVTLAIFDYDNATCALTPTGETASSWDQFFCIDVWATLDPTGINNPCGATGACIADWCASGRAAFVNPCYLVGSCTGDVLWHWEVRRGPEFQWQTLYRDFESDPYNSLDGPVVFETYIDGWSYTGNAQCDDRAIGRAYHNGGLVYQDQEDWCIL